MKNGSQSLWLNAYLAFKNMILINHSFRNLLANVQLLMFQCSCQIVFLAKTSRVFSKILFRGIYSRFSILDFVVNITENCAKIALIQQDNGLLKQRQVHCVI